MRKTIIATALLTAAIVGGPALAAEARTRPVAPNPPVLSGTVNTGRIIMTCTNPNALGWNERRKTEIKPVRLERTIRNGKIAFVWVGWVAPPGGHSSSSSAFKATWTAAAYPGEYRTYCRTVDIGANGAVTYGKWVQSPKTVIRAEGW